MILQKVYEKLITLIPIIKQQRKHFYMSEIKYTAEEYRGKYESLRKQINLPLKIKLYFSFLESVLDEKMRSSHLSHSQTFSKLLLTVFSRMSPLEKAYMLFSHIAYLKKQYDKFQNIDDPDFKSSLFKKNITVSGQMSQNVMGLTYWTSIQLIFLAEKRQIKVMGKKEIICLDLRLYLIRKSRKYKDTIVLEAVSDLAPSDEKKFQFSFKMSVFNELYKEIMGTIFEYRNEQILKLAMQEINTEQNCQEISFISKNSKALMFLNSKNVNQYLNFKDSVMKKILTNHFEFRTIYKLDNCIIERSRKYPSFYKMQCIFEENVKVLKEEFLRKYQEQAYGYLMQEQTLETFSQKYKAKYIKYLFANTQNGNKLFEHICIEECSSQDEEEVLFLKGMDYVTNKKIVDFVLVKIKELSGNKSELIVFGSFCNGWKKKKIEQGEFNREVILMFMQEWKNMLFRKDHIEHLSQLLVGRELNGEFVTVQGNFQKTLFNAEYVEEFVSDEEHEGNIFTEDMSQSLSYNNKQTDQSVFKPSEIKPQLQTYLEHYHKQKPYPITPQKDLLVHHFLWNDWNHKQSGGITCKDSRPIQEQKKVFKHILTMMGKNVLQNKGLLNVSLPVNVFRTESHLQSIARDFSFAPIFLEKAAGLDNLEKIKYSLLFSISVSILSISINKPFNPILGETLQVWIDGCPMYIEQISHHPPIASYYFIGRGYKVYGKIGTKAKFGLNVIYGYSDEPNFILFDDGTQIEVNFAKMAIKGILFGDRQYNFTEKMYAYDPKNNLFGSLGFGDQNKGLFSNSKQPSDYLEGKIMKVTPQFKTEFFTHSEVQYPHKKHIMKEMCNFEGIWNGEIMFDGVKYVDFEKENPCTLKEDEQPLPSNSTYRQDISYLLHGNLEAAQNAKEELENLQRRDRNLRQIPSV